MMERRTRWKRTCRRDEGRTCETEMKTITKPKKKPKKEYDDEKSGSVEMTVTRRKHIDTILETQAKNRHHFVSLFSA